MVFQSHQTAEIVAAVSDRLVHRFWGVGDKTDFDKLPVVLNEKPSEDIIKESVVCTAMAAIGDKSLYGIAMIIENRGLYLVRMETLEIVEVMKGNNIETTIAVDGCFFAVACKHNINVFSAISKTWDPVVIPIPHMKGNITAENRIWQLSLGKGTVCAVSTSAVSILYNNTDEPKKWAHMPIDSVVSSAVCTRPGSVSVALLCTLGDVIIATSDNSCGLFYIERLTIGSQIEPFVSSHTRDYIFAWQGDKIHMCKQGGGLHTIERRCPHNAAAVIQKAWRGYEIKQL